MKWLSLIGIWMFTGVLYACSVIMLSFDNPNTVYMASNIASGLFFKSTCARTMVDKDTSISQEAKQLMASWNLNDEPSIATLTNEEIREARLILVVSQEDKQKFINLHPDFAKKIHVMSECAGMTSLEAEPSLLQLREHLFKSEDVISTNTWTCLKKGK